MARSVVGKVFCISTSTGNGQGILDFTVDYFVTIQMQGPTTGRVIAKCDITQNDTQLTTALRQAVADAVNLSALVALSPQIAASDVVGCNV